MYRHILIATDGSELAERAVMSGVSLAKSLGAKVSVIIVEPSFEVYNVPESQVRQMSEAFAKHSEQIKKHAATVLDRAAETARAAGVTCNKIQMEHHSPYEAIITAANDGACDLIVMASHGRSGISAILLGSVTNKVLTHTKTPVLVVH
jgi:nucleotide-binding universal stress UspA family protein